MARDELGLEARGENERDRCEPVGWSHDAQLRRGISSSREEMVLNNTEQGELLGMRALVSRGIGETFSSKRLRHCHHHGRQVGVRGPRAECEVCHGLSRYTVGSHGSHNARFGGRSDDGKSL